jgi:hypothetical protein
LNFFHVENQEMSSPRVKRTATKDWEAATPDEINEEITGPGPLVREFLKNRVWDRAEDKIAQQCGDFIQLWTAEYANGRPIKARHLRAARVILRNIGEWLEGSSASDSSEVLGILGVFYGCAGPSGQKIKLE